VNYLLMKIVGSGDIAEQDFRGKYQTSNFVLQNHAKCFNGLL